MYTSPKNDAHRIILALGGVNAIATLFNISKFAVYAWIEKNSIPANRVLVLAKAQPALFDSVIVQTNAPAEKNEELPFAALCALEARVSELENRLPKRRTRTSKRHAAQA
jgi:hypothetical protein